MPTATTVPRRAESACERPRAGITTRVPESSPNRTKPNPPFKLSTGGLHRHPCLHLHGPATTGGTGIVEKKPQPGAEARHVGADAEGSDADAHDGPDVEVEQLAGLLRVAPQVCLEDVP